MSLVQNLKKEYKGFKLDIPKLEILDQGTTALIGASGSGKTSVLRLLLGLDECAGMSWQFGGVDLCRLPAPQRQIGVVFQGYELFPHLSAEKNILFAAEARKIPKAQAQKRLQELTLSLSLKEFLQRQAAVLSGGEKQRVALARALIGSPRLVFLDEPFSAMDEDLRGHARVLVAKVLAESRIPAVLVTHDERDLQMLADKVCVLKNGALDREYFVVK